MLLSLDKRRCVRGRVRRWAGGCGLRCVEEESWSVMEPDETALSDGCLVVVSEGAAAVPCSRCVCGGSAMSYVVYFFGE